MQSTNSVCYGIDLGTSNSCISAFLDCNSNFGFQNPTIIPNLDSNRLTPSCVTFADNEVLIGKSSKNCQCLYPKTTFDRVKRLIGRRYNELTIAEDQKEYEYKLYKNEKNDHFSFHVLNDSFYKIKDGKKVPIEIDPVQISAFILRNLLEDAEKIALIPTKKAVITVPANFNDSQRLAIKTAATIAGIDVIDVISEPIAAAIDYAYSNGYKSREQHILIFDLGGGTLDVALVKIVGNQFIVVATAGNPHFGGSDIDKFLFEKVLDSYREKTGNDLYNSVYNSEIVLKQRSIILQKCQDAKEVLSSIESYELVTDLPLKKGSVFQPFTIKLTRDLINSYVVSQKDNFIKPIDSIFEHTTVKKEQISKLVFVGGASKIPMVKEIVQKYVGVIPDFSIDASEAISMGAAIYGASKIKKELIKEFDGFVIRDITPNKISLLTRDLKLDVLVDENTPIPYKSEWKKYIKSSDESDCLVLPLYEGPGKGPEYDTFLGEFKIHFDEKDSRHIFARVNIEKYRLLIEVVKSDDKPSSDKIIQSVFAKNKNDFTEEEIYEMRADNESYLSLPKADSDSFLESILKFLNSLASIKTLKYLTSNFTTMNEIKKAVKNLKKEIMKKYNFDYSSYTKENFLEDVDKIEEEIRIIHPSYARDEFIEHLIQNSLK